MDEAVAAVGRLRQLDRRGRARAFERRFTASAMAQRLPAALLAARTADDGEPSPRAERPDEPWSMARRTGRRRPRRRRRVGCSRSRTATRFVVADAYRRHRRRRRRPVPRRHAPPVALPAELGGRPPALLGGAVSEDNVLFTANLTNRPLPPIGGQSTRQGVIHIERTRLIWEDRLYERISPAQLRPAHGTAAAAAGVRRRLPRHVRGARPARAQRAVGLLAAVVDGRFRRPELRGSGRAGCGSRRIAFCTPPDRSRAGPRRVRLLAVGTEAAHRHLLSRSGLGAPSRPSRAALPHRGGAGPIRQRGQCGAAAPRVRRPPAGCSATGWSAPAPIWRC